MAGSTTRGSKVEAGLQVAHEKIRKWMTIITMNMPERCMPGQGNIEKHEVQAHTAVYDS